MATSWFGNIWMGVQRIWTGSVLYRNSIRHRGQEAGVCHSLLTSCAVQALPAASTFNAQCRAGIVGRGVNQGAVGVPVQFRRHHTIELLLAWQPPGTAEPLLFQGLHARAAQGTDNRFGRGKEYALQIIKQESQCNKMYPRPVQPGK